MSTSGASIHLKSVGLEVAWPLTGSLLDAEAIHTHERYMISLIDLRVQ